MRLKESKTRIKIPVYDSEINMIVTEDLGRSFVKLCKKLEWLEMLEDNKGSLIDSACFLYDDEDVGRYYLLLPYNADVFVISHEVLHATFIILDHHDVMYDKMNHEVFTYLHGHLVETVYNKIKSLK